MDINDVANLLFAARERIDFYWNFYVVVVIAVIGWLVSLKKMLTRPMKVLVSAAFVIASLLKFLGLYSSYTFAEALRLDMLRLSASTPLTDTRIFLEQHSYASQQVAAIVTHLVVGAMILFVVWFARFSETEETAPKVAPGRTEASARERRKGV
jgi:hypothetical protein